MEAQKLSKKVVPKMDGQKLSKKVFPKMEAQKLSKKSFQNGNPKTFQKKSASQNGSPKTVQKKVSKMEALYISTGLILHDHFLACSVFSCFILRLRSCILIPWLSDAAFSLVKTYFQSCACVLFSVLFFPLSVSYTAVDSFYIFVLRLCACTLLILDL